MVPTLEGVHKIQMLIRDVLKENLQKIFGEEMGGYVTGVDPIHLSRGVPPKKEYIRNTRGLPK